MAAGLAAVVRAQSECGSIFPPSACGRGRGRACPHSALQAGHPLPNPSRKGRGFDVRGNSPPTPRSPPWSGSNPAAPRQWLFEPADLADLQAFLRDLDPATPFMALGLGSNLIVRDGGVPGVVVRLGKAFAKVELTGPPRNGEGDHEVVEGHRRVDTMVHTTLSCGGGASGILVSSTARDHGIAGLEFLRSIPGTVGGFCRMNGGAYGSEVKDILVDADILLRDGTLVRLCQSQTSATPTATRTLPEGAIVVAARFPWHPRRPRRHPGRNGPHRAGTRSQPATAQQDRRLDLQEPAP